MADETIIAGNPAVLRMKFERDGYTITATALDIGEMPDSCEFGGVLIRKRAEGDERVILYGHEIAVCPSADQDSDIMRTCPRQSAAEATGLMHSLAAAVNEMGRVHAPKVETVTITMADGSVFTGEADVDRWVELPVGAAPQFSIRDNCESCIWDGEGYSHPPSRATLWGWSSLHRFRIRPTEGRAWLDILKPSVAVPTADTRFFLDVPLAESDGDFALRILRERVDYVAVREGKSHLHMKGVQSCLANSDAIRLATLIGGAA